MSRKKNDDGYYYFSYNKELFTIITLVGDNILVDAAIIIITIILLYGFIQVNVTTTTRVSINNKNSIK